ncbi:hypothetical protein [uncultured Clostridium sp.]|uniref:hypothetical protein n=1 Tax=uncultured Clostridium sp. TaxID=59620 RepID=UPI00267152C9|nr:hypothetical protein [uncultured Clostridium sp.]
MSKKSELLNVIEGYKRQQELFKSKVTEIESRQYLMQEGKEIEIKKIATPFTEVAQNAQNRALEILNSGIEALEKKWRDNSTGRLTDSNYQIGLANTIKMIEAGAITNQEDFKNIINTYKDDYNALATIENLLGLDHPELAVLIPKDNREYNKKALNDLRNNIERYISPFSIRDSLTMNLDGMINFIKTRLKDDLTIIPWEEVK